MKDLYGSPGTKLGLLLRISQSLFAVASISLMASADGFSNTTAFCYLIASMGLQVIWSLGLASLDVYALWIKRDLRIPVLLSLFVVGDWVTAMLSLGAASSAGGVVVMFARDFSFCNYNMQSACVKYQISVAFAFITWFLIAISSCVTFWLLALL